MEHLSISTYVTSLRGSNKSLSNIYWSTLVVVHFSVGERRAAARLAADWNWFIDWWFSILYTCITCIITQRREKLLIIIIHFKRKDNDDEEKRVGFLFYIIMWNNKGDDDHIEALLLAAPIWHQARLSPCYYSRHKWAIIHSTEGRILIRVWVFVYTYAAAEYKSQHSILYSQHHYSIYFFLNLLLQPG